MIFKKKSAVNTNVANTINQSTDNTRILALVAEDYLKDKRSKRRWGMLLKGLLAAYLLAIVWMAVKGSAGNMANTKAPHVAVVKIEGVIGQDPDSLAAVINESLRTAFKATHAKGIILKVNSPGGTPVQSDQVYREIGRLRAKYPEKKLIAVVDDLCASGGYYIASAADEIYANPASIVGSIGVRMGGFGFVDTMKKLGVERRLVTAGENKGMLDPFTPVDQSQVKHAEKMLSQVHQQFITAVKTGRGDRLVETPGMFSGLFWSGEEAKSLGLVDEFGDSYHVAREIFETEKLVNYSITGTFIERFSRKLGASFGVGLMTSWIAEFNKGVSSVRVD